MASADDSTELLWNSSVTNKSWYELIEEEFEEQRAAAKATEQTVKSEPADSAKESKEEDKKEEPLKNFSLKYSSLLQTSSSEGSSTIKAEVEIKKEPVNDFLQEDISLTGHLDNFKLVSPCKPKSEAVLATVKTPESKRFLRDRVNIVGSSPAKDSPDTRATKRKIQIDPSVKAELTKDELLMPSPSKIPKQSTPRQTNNQGTPRSAKAQTPKEQANRKRQREITPRKGQSSEKRTPREIESDPEVLARRQKQIDYGKNTIGYDRYRQLVPKDSRSTMHPRTPPMHLKFSRRAWDGLIKAWRQRLHFWDPPSEGGGNPALLEGTDDISDADASSTDGSLPNTPMQEWRRRVRPKVETGEEEEDFDNQGCTPLPEER